MEENLINASDYIYNVLNVIETFEDFNQYKPELIKAILDIKNNLSKFFEKKIFYNYSNNNTNNEEIKNNNNIENNNFNVINNQKKTLSSSLGLRYNYDQYLDTIDKDIQPQNLKIINNSNENDNNNFNKKNNFFNQQQNQNNFNSNEINNNLIIPNKSISHNNLISLPQVFQSNNNENNNNKINIQNNNNNLFNQTYLKNNNENLNNNNNIPKLNKQIEIPSNDNKKNLLTHVADVAMKINNDKELFDILSELFGTNIVEELLNPNVNQEFLVNVEKSIEEIERLRAIDEQKTKKNNNNNNNIQILNNNQHFNNNNNNLNSEPLFYETGEEKKPLSQVKKPNYSDILLKKHNLEIKNVTNNNNNKIVERNEPYKEFNFESSLRFNMKRPQSCRRSNNNSHLTTNSNANNNNNNRQFKRFVNYTSNYGHYFDESLQKGGVSKLPAFKIKSSLNKRINSPLRDYIKNYKFV